MVQLYVWCTFSEDQVDLNFANPQGSDRVLRPIIPLLLERRPLLSFAGRRRPMERARYVLQVQPATGPTKLIQDFAVGLMEHHSRNCRLVDYGKTKWPIRENLNLFSANANENPCSNNFLLPPPY